MEQTLNVYLAAREALFRNPSDASTFILSSPFCQIE
jgi:hypothetical protein